jgi:Lipid desaturase domain
MSIVSLPNESKGIVVTCFVLQIVALDVLLRVPFGSHWLFLPASFLIAGFLTDLISGFAHFSFDYLWSPKVPVFGPISVDFRRHHEDPTLDPSAKLTNFTKGAYGAAPLAIAAILAASASGGSVAAFLVDTTLFLMSVWMLGFHQIHSYAHMGSLLLPQEFNSAVATIASLPSAREQRREFAKLFRSLGVPPLVRILQRCRLFLRPEIHWQHHKSFETDFSSVNGWSDPLMNGIYRRWTLRRKAHRGALAQSLR